MEKKKPKYPGDDPKGVTVPRLRRTPKVGDRVVPLGHHGAFSVTEVNSERKTAKLKNLASPDLVLIVGWQDLEFLDQLDESQNAARIVREATED